MGFPSLKRGFDSRSPLPHVQRHDSPALTRSLTGTPQPLRTFAAGSHPAPIALPASGPESAGTEVYASS